MAKKALGKGLGALIKKQSEAPVTAASKPVQEVDGQSVINVSLDQVIPSPLQPRKQFSESQIEELADSIKQHGIIQPLIVRQVNNKYELIAGERRWRASTSIGLKEVPIIVREASDRDVLEMALIENLQRADLNPIEEALGYHRLAKEFELKQEQIAKQVGKSRASVANSIRLLDLHEDVQSFLGKGQISVGHAKAILGLRDVESQLIAVDQIIKKKLTVRAAERLVKDYNKSKTASTASKEQSVEHSAVIQQIQDQLQKDFSTRVQIQHHKKKGKIEIEYYGNDDLNRILELLGVSLEEF